MLYTILKGIDIYLPENFVVFVSITALGLLILCPKLFITCIISLSLFTMIFKNVCQVLITISQSYIKL